MRTCGVEIKGSEALICVLSKDNDVFDIRDIRQTRFVLNKATSTEDIRKLQFDFAKLMQDYKVDTIAIKQRMDKGKFAGSMVGGAAANFSSKLVSGTVNSLAQQVFAKNGKYDFIQVAADSFGNTIAESITSELARTFEIKKQEQQKL